MSFRADILSDLSRNFSKENFSKLSVDKGMQSRKKTKIKNEKEKKAEMKKQFVSIVAFSPYNSLMHHKCSKQRY